MSDVDDLIEFLRARLDEDEKVASDAEHLVDRDAWLDILERSLGDGRDDAKRAATSYILEFRPSRMLAKVESKRRLLDDLYPKIKLSDETIAGEWGSDPCDSDKLLEMLALPYADHPAYREEWRP